MLEVTRLVHECVVSEHGDVLVLHHQVQLRVEIIDFVEGRMESNLALLNADVLLSFLLHKHLQHGDVRVHIVVNVAHFWVT